MRRMRAENFIDDKQEDFSKRRDVLKRREENAGGFKCSHCHVWIPINEAMGTQNRNHCASCLWSKHLDEVTPGDRKSLCGQGMKPIGLTFKQEGVDKYGKSKQGELMLIHECQGGDKISINRVAADDSDAEILSVFQESLHLSDHVLHKLKKAGIRVLGNDDLTEIKNQLYGKV